MGTLKNSVYLGKILANTRENPLVKSLGIFPRDSQFPRGLFPGDFPHEFSPGIFPGDFPRDFPPVIFPGDFPRGLSPRIFVEDFPRGNFRPVTFPAGIFPR